jgi:hypothetical protein
MHWIRMNRQWSGRLALFALALQLVLSFGHIHADDLGLAAPAAAAALHAPPTNGDGTPPQDQRDAHDICAICVTLSLSATSLLPVVAALTIPIAFEWEWPANIQTAQVIFDLNASYDARGPPHA